MGCGRATTSARDVTVFRELTASRPFLARAGGNFDFSPAGMSAAPGNTGGAASGDLSLSCSDIVGCDSTVCLAVGPDVITSHQDHLTQRCSYSKIKFKMLLKKKRYSGQVVDFNKQI